MIIFFLFSYVEAFCPEWVCKDLNETICTTLRGYQIYANTNGCPRDLFCKLSDFENWYILQSPSSTKTFSCTRQNYDGFSLETFKSQPKFFCGFRNLNDELAYGTHPKVCQSNEDCLTVGGWTSECLCGFDGLSYCAAELGSSAFDGY